MGRKLSEHRNFNQWCQRIEEVNGFSGHQSENQSAGRRKLTEQILKIIFIWEPFFWERDQKLRDL